MPCNGVLAKAGFFHYYLLIGFRLTTIMSDEQHRCAHSTQSSLEGTQITLDRETGMVFHPSAVRIRNVDEERFVPVR